MLTEDESLYYLRQISVREFGISGQSALKSSKVLCVGAGGIGSAVLMYLVSAGVGYVGIIDLDKVEISNLQRQVIFSDDNIGYSKVDSAKTRLNKLNKNVIIKTYNEKLSHDNAEQIFSDYDVIIDGSDNMETKLLVNDYSMKLKKVFIIAGAVGFRGNIGVFMQPVGCYRCLFGHIEITTSNGCISYGIMGYNVGVIGTITSGICINIIAGLMKLTQNMLYTWDGLSISLKGFYVNKSKTCALCSAVLDDAIRPRSSFGNIGVHVHDLGNSVALGARIIDIRGYSERNVVIPGSEHILSHDVAVKESKDSHIILCCRSGTRAQVLAESMQNEGFKNTFYLVGGIEAWENKAQ